MNQKKEKIRMVLSDSYLINHELFVSPEDNDTSPLRGSGLVRSRSTILTRSGASYDGDNDGNDVDDNNDDVNNKNTLKIKKTEKEPLGRTRSDGILSLKKKYRAKQLFLSPKSQASLADIALEPINYFYSERMQKRRTGLSTCSLASSTRRSRSTTHVPSDNDSPCLSRQKNNRNSLARQHESISSGDNQNGRNMASQSIRGNSDKSADRIVINVGGTRHETFKSTLRIYPDTRLGWLSIEGSDTNDAYDPALNEYFFDRHPTAFNQIINFYRTGKLHAPSDICGPLFEEELQFWGLDEKTMEPCCWPKYTEHRDAQENLKVFDSPLLNPQDDDEPDPIIRINNPAIMKENQRLTNRLLKFIRPSFCSSLKWAKAKKNVWAIMEGRSDKRPMLAKALSVVSLTFIVLSVLSLFFHSMLLVLETQDIHKTFTYLLITLDYMTFVWMTFELVLRFVSCPRRLSFILSMVTLIDILVLITYALQFQYGDEYHKRSNHFYSNSFEIDQDKKKIEMFSVIRLFRLWRFFRLTIGLQIFKHTLIASSKELLLLVLLLSIPVAFFATVVYFFEREKDSTKFKTIPESIWWAVITITTVGYGDMTPVSSWGKLFGSICAVFSVLILALPVSIIGNNFSLFYNYAQARMKLPKRPKIALVGAANALVAETSQHSMSPDMEDSDVGSNCNEDEEEEEKNDSHQGLPKINLGSDPDFNANVTSKRFRRERLSLFASSPSRQSTRRSKSMGNSASGKVRNRQRNGQVGKPRKTGSSDDEISDTGSEKFEVFKPVGYVKPSNVTNSFDNGAFDDSVDNNKKVEVATEEKEQSITGQVSKVTVKPTETSHNKIGDTDMPDSKSNIPVPVIETVFTDPDQDENNGQITNGHLPPLLNEPITSIKRASYKKFSSPPVMRKLNGEIECIKPLTDRDIDSPEFPERKKKYSNNHLYVPHDVC